MVPYFYRSVGRLLVSLSEAIEPLGSTWIYMGWSDVTVLCGLITISMLLGNTPYCVKLNVEDLSRYSIIE